jgi:hypothetical protein
MLGNLTVSGNSHVLTFITLSASAVWELFGEIEGAQKKVN